MNQPDPDPRDRQDLELYFDDELDVRARLEVERRLHRDPQAKRHLERLAALRTLAQIHDPARTEVALHTAGSTSTERTTIALSPAPTPRRIVDALRRLLVEPFTILHALVRSPASMAMAAGLAALVFWLGTLIPSGSGREPGGKAIAGMMARPVEPAEASDLKPIGPEANGPLFESDRMVVAESDRAVGLLTVVQAERIDGVEAAQWLLTSARRRRPRPAVEEMTALHLANDDLDPRRVLRDASLCSEPPSRVTTHPKLSSQQTDDPRSGFPRTIGQRMIATGGSKTRPIN